MLVSVIIPNYNHGAYLRQRIESVVNQTYSSLEIILLDDCSTDNSREIMEQYKFHPKISHLVYNERNSGIPFKQWVRGFELSRGEFIWIAESDDFADLSFLEQCVAKLSHSGHDFVHTDSRIVDEKGEGSAVYSQKRNDFFKSAHWSRDHVTTSEQTILDYLLYRCIINNASSALFRKKLLEGLDLQKLVSYRNAGDLYFYLHVLGKTSCCYIAQPLNCFRYHGQNITIKNSATGLVQREAFEILTETILNYTTVDVERRAKLKKALKFVQLYFGAATLKKMPVTFLISHLSQLVKKGLLSLTEASSLFIHVQYAKLGVRGLNFLSTSILKTDFWRKLHTTER